MRTTRSTFVLAGLVLALGLGCKKAQNPESAPDGVPSDAPTADSAPTDPHAYFPVKVGTRWVYKMEPGATAAANQWEIIWPQRDGTQRVYFMPVAYGGSEGTLAVSIHREMPPPAPKGLDTKYDSAVAVSVEVDGPLRYTLLDADKEIITPREVVWAVRSKPFAVDEVLLFDGKDAPAGAAQETGHQVRPVCFDSELITTERIGSRVSLQGLPKDRNVPGHEGKPCLHLIRKIKSGRGDSSPHITEDLWYAPGKGLVRLVQKVEGKVAMTWTLAEFAP